MISEGDDSLEEVYTRAPLLEDRGEYRAAAELYERAIELGDHEYAPMNLASLSRMRSTGKRMPNGLSTRPWPGATDVDM